MKIKSIELLRAWSFYLSSSSSLIRCNKPSGHYISQPLISISTLSTLSFVLLPIRLYHPQFISFIISDLVFASRVFYTFNQVKFRPTYLLSDLSATGLYTRSFCQLVHAPTLIDYGIWQSWCLHKWKVLSAFSKTFIHIATK